MDLSIVRSSVKKAGETMVRNSPTILTGFSVAGLVTTTILAVNATPRALRLIQEEADRKYKGWEDSTGEDASSYPIDPILTKMEMVKLTWKCYIPATVMGALTIAAIVSSNHINLRRNAALVSAYSLTETVLKEYQAKVIETLGEKKEQKIHDDIAQDRLSRDPVTRKEIIVTGKGETLCYDSLSGRYFKSDLEAIRKVQNDFNYAIINSEGYKVLNEFYDDLDLEHTKLGEDLGWSTENPLDIKFSAKITDDGKPCIVLDYRVSPKKF